MKGKFSDKYKYADGSPMESRYSDHGMGLDWMAYSINWMEEWERTGDTKWRDRVLAGMKNIAALGTGGGGEFTYIFGGPEMMYEEIEMFDCPEYWDYFTKAMEQARLQRRKRHATSRQACGVCRLGTQEPGLGQPRVG